MGNYLRIEKGIELAEEQYRKRTTRSKQLNEEAERYLPAGDTRQACYFRPYPTYMARGEGCMLYDVDGNSYIDVLNNYTQQIHGHRHSPTMDVVAKQLDAGTIFGAPHEAQFKLARLLKERLPSVEKIRFSNSGTEATMIALKGARAFTNKMRIIKFEGMYHGTHDLAEVSVFPSIEAAGDEFAPFSVAGNAGIPQSTIDQVIALSLNNHEAFEAAIDRYKDEVAAVIMEPVMTSSGVIEAEKDFLQLVRFLTAEHGIVLIFDEVVTFRLGTDGGQGKYDIMPDITTLGKFIGGGFPVGAIGGKEEFMSVFKPSENVFASDTRKVKHSGTFNGHPIIMMAGLTTMQSLTPEMFAHINSLGADLQMRLNKGIFERLGLRMQATNCGSLLYIHYTDAAIRNYRGAKTAVDKVGRLPHLIHMEMLNQGINIAERGEIAISTPMGTEDVIKVAQAYERAIENILPAIKKDLPFLLI